MKVTLIKGDGIGPEVVDAAVCVLEASGVDIEWEIVVAGEGAKVPLPEEVIESILKNKVALKGPITTPIAGGFTSVNVELRKRLGLFAGVRPAISLPIPGIMYNNVNLVIIRENTEGLYWGKEYKIEGGAEAIRRITYKGCENIINFAFRYAQRFGYSKVTAVHKANILKLTCGIFLETAKKIASLYPQIEFEDRLVDNMAHQLVKNPSQFQVIVTTNLFGDILADEAAGIIGGLGLAPSANIGKDLAVFEPVHGSAPKYAGKNIANPTATILSACMLLEHINLGIYSKKIRRALEEVLREGRFLTRDMGGETSCSDFAAAVAERCKNT